MKRRVALISSCAPPLPGTPVTGGGLRTAQLLETLRSAGHSVRLFVEAEALPKKAPKALREHSFNAKTLEQQVRAFRPSVIVVEQWALVALVAGLSKALVVDLHGSLLLENVYRRGDVDLTLDAGTKIQALARADLLLVPATVQAHHFASWATLAGFDPRELPIAVMPLAMADPPAPRRAKKPSLKLVYGGARWPWIDSLEPLLVAAETVATIKGARLDVFTYEPPRHGLPFEEDLGTWPEVITALSGREDEGIYLHDATEHPRWQAFLQDEATVALDLWRPNPERMLAATTRTVEFLWAGLPVITVQGAAWAETLLGSGAGWALEPGNSEQLSSLIERLAEQPGDIATASTAATELIGMKHSLEQAGQALLTFCDQPQRPARSQATLLQSLVALREAHLKEELRSMAEAHEDEHKAIVRRHRTEIDTLSEEHRNQVDALVDGHRLEVHSEHKRRTDEVTVLTAEHGAQVDELVADHRSELQQERARQSKEIKRLTSEHSTEIKTLVQKQQKQVTALDKRHQGEIDTVVKEGRERLEKAAKAADDEARKNAKAHRSAMASAATEQRKQLSVQKNKHSKETDKLVAQWQRRVEKLETRAAKQQETAATELQRLASEQRDELQRVVTEHRSAVAELTATHRAETRLQAEENSTALQVRDQQTRDELEQVVEAHRAEIDQLSQTHRKQVEQLAAERQDEVHKLVGQGRAELEQADERHRAETDARDEEFAHRIDDRQAQINELQQQLASERRRVKEERTRLEVELRAEMAARELDWQQQMVAREAELGEVLELANRTLAQKLKDRLATPEGWGPLPGRLAPAARLARLWAEHAVDRSEESEE